MWLNISSIFFATFFYYNCGKFNTFLFLARPCFALSLLIAYASVLHTRVFANVGSKEEFVAHTQCDQEITTGKQLKVNTQPKCVDSAPLKKRAESLCGCEIHCI